MRPIALATKLVGASAFVAGLLVGFFGVMAVAQTPRQTRSEARLQRKR